MPGAKLDFFNRGVSGNKVGDLRKRWQKDAIEMNPDWLSILVGVNDVSQSRGQPVNLEKWEEDYRHILNASREKSGSENGPNESLRFKNDPTSTS